MKLFIDEINEVVKNAFEELGYERETGRVNVSNRPDLCQYQCNGALANAKKHKKAPMIIAQEVVEKLNDNQIDQYDGLEVQVAHSYLGYIDNSRISSSWCKEVK